MELATRLRAANPPHLLDVRELEEHQLVALADSKHIPLGQLATLSEEEGPSVLSREEGERLTTVEANVRGRDIGNGVPLAGQEFLHLG